MKTAEILTGHMSPRSIATEAIPTDQLHWVLPAIWRPCLLIHVPHWQSNQDRTVKQSNKSGTPYHMRPEQNGRCFSDIAIALKILQSCTKPSIYASSGLMCSVKFCKMAMFLMKIGEGSEKCTAPSPTPHTPSVYHWGGGGVCHPTPPHEGTTPPIIFTA